MRLNPIASIHLAALLAASCGEVSEEATATSAVVGVDTYTSRWALPGEAYLLDWGRATMVDPALAAAGTLEVHYCQDHFPAGSTALDNLTAAVNVFNQIPGLSLNLAVVAEPGTAVHPNLATFSLPSGAIYIDYDSMAPGTWAATAFTQAVCTQSIPLPAPRTCDRARIYLSAENYPTDTDPTIVDDAPSVGVYLHELGHAFGEVHIDPVEATADPESLRFERIVIHGGKTEATDLRTTNIPAATLTWLLEWYGDGSAGLEVDELSVHPVIHRTNDAATAIKEFSVDKRFVHPGGDSTLMDGLNEVKLRWNRTSPFSGYFETCADSTKPVWLAHYSEISNNYVDTLYAINFEVSTLALPGPGDWNEVARREDLHSHGKTVVPDVVLPNGVVIPGFTLHTTFRQEEWTRELNIRAADVGLTLAGPAAMEMRQLAFTVDADDDLTERREGNDRWEVTICLYPENDDCSGACP